MNKTFVCHFDASLKSGRAACAYIICCDGKLIHHDVVVTNCTKADMAEATALFFLLTHIEIYVKASEKIKIHGDAKGVIDSINNGNGSRYSKTLLLYQKLMQKHKMRLSHVPRKQNKKADTLARNAIIKDSLREIRLQDIVVSENHILPGLKKLQMIEDYFNQTGKLFTTIRVSHNNRLISGYGEYQILLNANVEHWLVSA